MAVCARARVGGATRAPRRGGGRAAAVRVRAAAGDKESPLEKYMEVSRKVPPVVTAAAVPVVGLSLLCKAVTGSGLPGDVLGLLEGLAWVALPLGAGGLYPVAKEIVESGDFSRENVYERLTGAALGAGRGGASARIDKLTSRVDEGSALGMQLKDLEAKRKMKESLSDEERKAREERKAKLAASVLKDAQDRYSKTDVEA